MEQPAEEQNKTPSAQDGKALKPPVGHQTNPLKEDQEPPENVFLNLNRSVEETAHAVLKVAQAMLKRRGGIDAHAMIIDPVNKTAYYVSLATDKALWRLLILSVLRRANAERYFLVDEVWTVTAENWVPNLAVSENPAKVEAIIVMVCDRTKGKMMITQQFLRDKDGIKFLEPNVSDTFETRLAPETW